MVALKLLAAVRPDDLLRFKEEFRVLRDLHHPNLVQFGELFELDGRWWFTMEHLRGESFHRHLRGAECASSETDEDYTDADTRTPTAMTDQIDAHGDRGDHESRITAAGHGELSADSDAHPEPPSADPQRPCIAEGRLRSSLAQLATAVAALHRIGIVHRDIKPSNILVEPDGRLVLLDFGIAGGAGSDADAKLIVGTPRYMAPEQAKCEKTAPAADWYSVGVLLFQALTGRHPFIGEARGVLRAKLREPAPRVRELVPDAPADLCDLCDRLLARRPEDRPPEAEILSALGAEAPDAWVSLSPMVGGDALPFVGRDAEMTELMTAFYESGPGHPMVIRLHGPSGIGKSRLAHELLREIESNVPRTVTLRGRCHEKEEVRFKAMDGVIDDLTRTLRSLAEPDLCRLIPDNAESLATVFPVLLSIPFVREAAESHSLDHVEMVDRRMRAFSAMRRLLTELSRKSTVVIAIDDWQWADRDSAHLLQEIMEGADAPDVLLVLTERDSPKEKSRSPRLETGRRPLDLTLRGLSDADARRLFTDLAGDESLTDEAATRAVAEAEGHPMFVDELARMWREHGAADISQMHLDEAIVDRTRTLSPAGRELLEIICIAGAPTRHGVIAEVASVEPRQYAQLSDILRTSRLSRISGIRKSDSVEPYHDRVREAVVEHLDEDRILRVHARLADVLSSRGASPERVAVHHLRAERFERAAEAFLEAAELAYVALAFDRAASRYALALKHGVMEVGERRRVTARMAEALASAGLSVPAAHAFVDAAELGPPDPIERDGHLRRAAEILLSGAHLEEALAVTRRLLSSIGMSLPGNRYSAFLRLLWEQSRLDRHSLEWTPRRENEVSKEDLARLDSLWSVAGGMAFVDSVSASMFGARSALHALDVGEPVRLTRALSSGSFAANVTGRLKHADRLHDATVRAASGDTNQLTQFYVRLSKMTGDFLTRNDWSTVVEESVAAEEIFEVFTPGYRWELEVLYQLRYWSHDNRGDLAVIRSKIPERIRWAQQTGNRFVEVNYRTFFINAHLADHRPGDALEDVEDAIAGFPGGLDEFSNQDFLALRSRTLIALYTGDIDGLGRSVRPTWKRFFRSLLRMVVLLRQDGYMLVASLSLAEAARRLDEGKPRDARRALREARRNIRRLAGVPIPLAQLYVSIHSASLAHLEGEEERALDGFRRALAAARARDMKLVGACVSYRLGLLLGEGDEEGRRLLAESRAWAVRERVQRLDRLAHSVVPGFDVS